MSSFDFGESVDLELDIPQKMYADSEADMNRLAKFELLEEEELEVIEAAILSLEQHENPLRLSNFTLGIRTFLDWFMKKEAPEESVMECDWYQERKLKCGCLVCQQNVKVETVQKLRYILVKKLDSSMYGAFFDDGKGVADRINKLKKMYSKLNSYVHFTPSNFNPTDAKVKEVVDNVFDMLEDYFWELEYALEYTNEYLKEFILQNVVEYYLSEETINGIDILATRYYVEDFALDASEITFSSNSNQFNEEYIDGTGTGVLEVIHYYGGSNDLSDGYSCSYPVSFTFGFDLANFSSLEVKSYEVDTSSFYGDKEFL